MKIYIDVENKINNSKEKEFINYCKKHNITCGLNESPKLQEDILSIINNYDLIFTKSEELISNIIKRNGKTIVRIDDELTVDKVRYFERNFDKNSSERVVSLKGGYKLEKLKI